MSLDEIKKSIDKDGRARAESIREEGASEAAAIIREAHLKAAEFLKSAKAEAEKEAGRVRSEHISGAQIEVNSMIIAARESVLEHHMPALKRSIASQLSAKRLDRLLAGAASQFSRFAPKGEMVVRAGKRNAAMVRKLGYSHVQGEEGELSVETKDGSITIDASPAGLTEMHAPEARALLAARLWKVKG